MRWDACHQQRDSRERVYDTSSPYRIQSGRTRGSEPVPRLCLTLDDCCDGKATSLETIPEAWWRMDPHRLFTYVKAARAVTVIAIPSCCWVDTGVSRAIVSGLQEICCYKDHREKHNYGSASVADGGTGRFTFHDVTKGHLQSWSTSPALRRLTGRLLGYRSSATKAVKSRPDTPQEYNMYAS